MRALPLLLLGCRPEVSDLLSGDPTYGGRVNARLDLPDVAMSEEDAAPDTRPAIALGGATNALSVAESDSRLLPHVDRP